MTQIPSSSVIKASRTYIVSTIDKGRNYVAGLIAGSKLLYRRQLSDRFMPVRHRKMVAEFIESIGRSKVAFDELVSTLTTLSPRCSAWLTDEYYRGIYPAVTGMGLGPARLLASDALLSMLGALGTPETIVTFFDRYVDDVVTFQATMLAFLQFPLMLDHMGYIERETYLLKRPDDAAIVRLMYTDHVTNALVRAVPGKWDYDVLLEEIRSLHWI